MIVSVGQTLASPELMRDPLCTVINPLLSAEADAVSPERVNSRNGYRRRQPDTRIGTPSPYGQ